MLLWSRIRTGLLLWAFAEVIVFAVLAHVFGFGSTLLALLFTSLFGLVLLKRAGTSAQIKLRAVLQGRAERTGAADGALEALGAIALVLPGFLSDLVGLALLVPSVRAHAIARFGTAIGWRDVGGAPPHPSTLDLSPDEWRRTDGRRPPEITG